jgi:hypothetical protein
MIYIPTLLKKSNVIRVRSYHKYRFPVYLKRSYCCLFPVNTRVVNPDPAFFLNPDPDPQNF